MAGTFGVGSRISAHLAVGTARRAVRDILPFSLLPNIRDVSAKRPYRFAVDNRPTVGLDI
jgi:hypothetical protein